MYDFNSNRPSSKLPQSLKPNFQIILSISSLSETEFMLLRV